MGEVRMSYIATTGRQYICITTTGNITKSGDPKKAEQFETLEAAVEAAWCLMDYKMLIIDMETKKICWSIEARDRTMIKRRAFTKEEREYIYRRDNGICQLCGEKLQYEDMTIDHAIPLSDGGRNEISNYQCSCLACNQLKNNIQPKDFYEKITEIFWYQTQKNCGKSFTDKLARLLVEA